MPNLIDQMEILKNLPDGALAGELNQPSGAVPPYLVLSEVNRRKDMRQRFAGQAALQKPQTTVAQDMSASLAPPPGAAAGQGAPMAPPGGIGSSPAMPGAPMPAPTGIAAAAGYRNGGVVHYASGGYVGNLNDLIPSEPGTYIGNTPLPTGGVLGTYGYDPSQSAAAGIAGAIPAGANGVPIDMSAAGTSAADAPAISMVPSADNGLPPADGSIASAPFGQDYSGLTKQYEKELADSAAAKARDPWLALMQAGLSIAGGTSPYALSNIGAGGAEGLNTYAALEKGDNASSLAATQGLMGVKAQQDKEQAEQADQANEAAKIKLASQSPAEQFADAWIAAKNDPAKQQALQMGLTHQPNAFGVIPTVDASGMPLTPQQVPLLPNGQPDPAAQAQLLGQMDPSTAGLMKGIINYEIPLSVGSKRNDQQQKLAAMAKLLDPTFDATQYAARNRMRMNATSGAMGQALTSANLVIEHLGQLSTATDSLQNQSGLKTPWNTVANAAKGTFGDPVVTNYNETRDAAATELAKVFKGSGVTDVSSLNEWRHNFDVNAAPEQQKQAIATGISLLKSRIDTIKQQYQNAMGKPLDFQFLTPEAAGILTRLGLNPADFGASGAPAPTGTSTPDTSGAASAPTPNAVEVGTKVPLENGVTMTRTK